MLPTKPIHYLLLPFLLFVLWAVAMAAPVTATPAAQGDPTNLEDGKEPRRYFLPLARR